MKLNDALRPAATSNTTASLTNPSSPPSPSSQRYSPVSPVASLWNSTHTFRSTRCLIQEPCSGEEEGKRQMSNIKHTGAVYCTYTADRPDLQRSLLRPNMWKATCVQGPPAWCCTCFQATSNEIGSASQCSPSFFLSEPIPRLNADDRKHKKKKKKERESNWFPRSRQTFRADSEICWFNNM